MEDRTGSYLPPHPKCDFKRVSKASVQLGYKQGFSIPGNSSPATVKMASAIFL